MWSCTPPGNTDVGDECERYATLVADDSTFSAVTLEAFLAAGALPRADARALRLGTCIAYNHFAMYEERKSAMLPP